MFWMMENIHHLCFIIYVSSFMFLNDAPWGQKIFLNDVFHLHECSSAPTAGRKCAAKLDGIHTHIGCTCIEREREDTNWMHACERKDECMHERKDECLHERKDECLHERKDTKWMHACLKIDRGCRGYREREGAVWCGAKLGATQMYRM